jgi:hypothetical protein
MNKQAVDELYEELSKLPTIEVDDRKIHAYPWKLKKSEGGYNYWIQDQTKLADKVKISP